MENFFLGGGAVCTAHSRLSSTRRNASQSANTNPALPWTSRAAALPAEASLQYLVLHLLHLFLWSWASGAAQAAQFVGIILINAL